MHSLQKFPSSCCGTLVPGNPLGKLRRERGKAPGGRCFSFLQLLWIYPEVSVDEESSANGSYSRTGELTTIVVFFSSGKEAGGTEATE